MYYTPSPMPTPVITLRVDAVTRARWEAAALAEGVNLSDFIRNAANVCAAPPPPGEERPFRSPPVKARKKQAVRKQADAPPVAAAPHRLCPHRLCPHRVPADRYCKKCARGE